jgi:hypothetical protein
MILAGAALIPAPVRAGDALEEAAVEPGGPAARPVLSRAPEVERSTQTVARSH